MVMTGAHLQCSAPEICCDPPQGRPGPSWGTATLEDDLGGGPHHILGGHFCGLHPACPRAARGHQSIPHTCTSHTQHRGEGGRDFGWDKVQSPGRTECLGNAAPARTHTTPPAKAAGITPKQPQKCPVGGGTHPEQGQRSSQHCRQPPLPPQNTAPAPPGPRDSPLPHTSGGRATRQGSRGLCSRDGNGGDGRDWRGPRLAAKPPPLASVRQGWT